MANSDLLQPVGGRPQPRPRRRRQAPPLVAAGDHAHRHHPGARPSGRASSRLPDRRQAEAIGPAPPGLRRRAALLRRLALERRRREPPRACSMIARSRSRSPDRSVGMPGLPRAEEVAGPAQLEVALGDDEPVRRLDQRLAAAPRPSRRSGSWYSSRQDDWCAPRPTRPRSWCSWASPNRSACSTTITVAFGTSMPTSMTVVDTRTCTSPAGERPHHAVLLLRPQPAVQQRHPVLRETPPPRGGRPSPSRPARRSSTTPPPAGRRRRPGARRRARAATKRVRLVAPRLRHRPSSGSASRPGGSSRITDTSRSPYSRQRERARNRRRRHHQHVRAPALARAAPRAASRRSGAARR